MFFNQYLSAITHSNHSSLEMMKHKNLRDRTKAFALRVLNLVEHLPRGRSVEVIARQLVRSGTSVGANYRAASRARSRADFIAKMKIVEEETDESAYWLELLVEGGFMPEEKVSALLDEANQLIAIVVASIKTARGVTNDSSDE